MTDLHSHLTPGETLRLEARPAWPARLLGMAVVCITMYPARLIRLFTAGLLLTDLRAIGRSGGIHSAVVSLPYARIRQVSVRKGGLGWMFDYGTVTLERDDGARFTFDSLVMPALVQHEIDEAIEFAILGQTLAEFSS